MSYPSGPCRGGPWDGQHFAFDGDRYCVAVYPPMSVFDPIDAIVPSEIVSVGAYTFRDGEWIWDGSE